MYYFTSDLYDEVIDDHDYSLPNQDDIYADSWYE